MVPNKIGELAVILNAAFPAATETDAFELQPEIQSVDKPNPSQLFERGNRFFYINAWRKGGLSRLYLKSSDGNQLGWKDVDTKEIQISCVGDEAKLAQAILEYASPVGVTLAADALPKLPINLPGGKWLSTLAKIRLAVFIGQEWQKGPNHRLYATYVDPMNGTFFLVTPT